MFDARKEADFSPDRPVSKLLYDSDAMRVVVFGLLPGQEIPPHTAPSRVVLHMVQEESVMETITRNMVINDVIKKHPQTIKVFNDYKVDSCCGGGAPIETTAKRDGIDIDGLLKALNAAAAGK